MIFPKPNLKYTEMAMYIDERVKVDKDLSEQELELIYIYLYHLIRMLAYKNKYFNKSEYYDEFSLVVASDVMNRLLFNPKLNELDENNEPKMTRIKSVLNYLKIILYGRKVNFEQQEYSQKISPQSKDNELTELAFATQIHETKRNHIDSNIRLYMGELSRTIKHFINTNCEYKDKMLRKNIRISCYLSLLNIVTFTNQTLDEVRTKYKTPEAKFNYLCSRYEMNRQDSIILYHLPEEYRNYITIMVRRICSLIDTDIKELSAGDNYISDNVLADIAFAELDGMAIDDN